MPSEFIINVTGVAALAMNLRGLVQKSDHSLQKSSAWSSALWALNSFLLGAHSAAAMNVVSVGRQAAAASVDASEAKLRALACAAFLAVTGILATFTWNGLTTASTAAASMLATTAMFYLRGARLRVALAAVAALWIYNGIFYEAWWQLTSTFLSLAMAMFGAWRTRHTW
jgi:hypothetical protein